MKNTRKRESEKKVGRKTDIEDSNIQQEYEFRHRKFLIFLIAVCTVLESVAAGIISRQTEDRCLVLLFLGIFYSVLFLTGMELYRNQQDWFYEKIGNYLRLVICHGSCCTAAVLFLFLPEFARPVMLLSFVMSMAASPFFGIAAGIFHASVYALCGLGNIYVMLSDLLLLLCGCLALSILRKKEYFRWGTHFLFLFTFGSIMIFSYLETGQLELNMLIYGLCNAVLTAFLVRILYQRLAYWLQKPVSAEKKMEKILAENFDLVRAVKEYSATDYLHARKVSEIAENCARLVGADPFIAAAGGFYYRLGRMEGEPYVENGVALAKSNYLPREIVAILEEYNGEKKPPSTVESAVVHIVDSVVGKFDVLDKNMLSSSWNQDILVYQTLNENSAAGLYDKSGFSMNMFLKIRDYLIKEAKMF